jgi:2-oxoglutarate ferredoxin oxidoreductase subunit alpha
VELSRRVTRILLVAMNAEQRVPDLRLAVDRRVPAKPFGRMGGMLTSPEEIWENLGRMTQEPLAEH